MAVVYMYSFTIKLSLVIYYRTLAIFPTCKSPSHTQVAVVEEGEGDTDTEHLPIMFTWCVAELNTMLCHCMPVLRKSDMKFDVICQNLQHN